MVIRNESVTDWTDYHISVEMWSRGEGRKELERGLPCGELSFILIVVSYFATPSICKGIGERSLGVALCRCTITN